MAEANTPKSLIINSPFQRPEKHWSQDSEGGALEVVEGRRPAGYEIFDIRNNTRRVEELELVNRIRPRVQEWREEGYPGVTSVTRRLLEHWGDPEARDRRFYFCQLEAIETLIWWVEAPAEAKRGIEIPGDGGAWERLCSKMATGTGKTVLMGLIITWQVLNALTYPRRTDFSSAVFVVTPGLTVKERLGELHPGREDNIYDQFHLCPSEALRQKINRADILVENWHQLMPETDADRSVVKKGPEGDEAFARRVLGPLAAHKRLVVINDEAHHAYRVPAEEKSNRRVRQDAAEHGIDLEEATRWVEGLDRIHRIRSVLRCFDITATPFAPTGKQSTEKGLFEWIVSDFGLNDAIEAGLVKTPRVVVRGDALPDASTYRPKLYHLYGQSEVKEDLNRKDAKPHEPLPELVQNAYALLGYDWRETARAWAEEGHEAPPVLLTVCNSTQTAARIEHFFNSGDCLIPDLQAPQRTLRVDSRVLEKAEQGEHMTRNKAYAARLEEIIRAAGLPADREADLLEQKQEEQLRAIVDNVGKPDTPGQHLQNVISVAMLAEGWDAANVTHIMGLRAFTSQLLCEQVIGRGLRRVSYEIDDDGLFRPEFVNVFGVPLSVFQDVGEGGEAPPTPKASVQVRALPKRKEKEIRWPNILRVDTLLSEDLVLDWDNLEPLELKPSETTLTAEVAPALAGYTDLEDLSEIDLEQAASEFRFQSLLFRSARKLYLQHEALSPAEGSRLAIQLIRLAEKFLGSDALIIPSRYHNDHLRRRLLIALNLDRIVAHISSQVQKDNREHLEPIFDQDMPIGSTAFMRPWYTTKPCKSTQHSQISHAVADSTWEATLVDALEKAAGRGKVAAYAKNDHLGFAVRYFHRGSARNYVPDFLIRFANGIQLILEVKGRQGDKEQAKREALDTWVEAVNAYGGFGEWAWDGVYSPDQIQDVLQKYFSQ